MKKIWLLLLIVASCHATFAQKQSIDELRRVFDYDQNASLDIKEVGVINRNGVRIHDITYASPKSGRVTAYLVVPAEKGRFAAVVYFKTVVSLDAINYVAHAAPTPLLFQFARFERYFNEASMRRYAATASEPKQVLWYDTGHELNDLEPLIDRAKCLQRYIGFGPIAPILLRSLEQAPQVVLKDIDGRTVRLSDYKGKVVLINFWATWCPPCRAEMPDLVRLQREHANHGLQIIGITYPPERKDRVQRFARSIKVNYPIILGTREIRARFSSEETLPLTVVIDRDGKVSDIISGILLREEFDEKIKPLLMQKER